MTDIKVIHAFQLSKARHEGVAAKELMRIAESEENRKLEPEDYLHQFMISCISNWTIGENIGIAPDKLSKTDKITSVCERIVEISELPGQGGWGKANFATYNGQLYIYRHNHFQRLPERFISRLIKAAGLQLRLHQADYLNVKFAEACDFNSIQTVHTLLIILALTKLIVMQPKFLTLCMALCATCLNATSQNLPDYVPSAGIVGWFPF